MHPGLAHPRILHKVVALEVAFTDRLVTPHLRPLSPGCQATQSPQVLLAAFLWFCAFWNIQIRIFQFQYTN